MRNMGFGYVGLKAVVKRMLGEVDVMVRKMIRGDEWRELKEYLLKFLVVRQKFKEKILDFLQGKFILEKFDYEFQEEFWGEANREKGWTTFDKLETIVNKDGYQEMLKFAITKISKIFKLPLDLQTLSYTDNSPNGQNAKFPKSQKKFEFAVVILKNEPLGSFSLYFGVKKELKRPKEIPREKLKSSRKWRESVYTQSRILATQRNEAELLARRDESFFNIYDPKTAIRTDRCLLAERKRCKTGSMTDLRKNFELKGKIEFEENLKNQGKKIQGKKYHVKSNQENKGKMEHKEKSPIVKKIFVNTSRPFRETRENRVTVQISDLPKQPQTQRNPPPRTEAKQKNPKAKKKFYKSGYSKLSEKIGDQSDQLPKELSYTNRSIDFCSKSAISKKKQNWLTPLTGLHSGSSKHSNDSKWKVSEWRDDGSGGEQVKKNSIFSSIKKIDENCDFEGDGQLGRVKRNSDTVAAGIRRFGWGMLDSSRASRLNSFQLNENSSENFQGKNENEIEVEGDFRDFEKVKNFFLFLTFF